MSIHITCPACQVVYTLSDNLGGKQVVCKQCRRTFTVAVPAPVEKRRSPVIPLVAGGVIGALLVLVAAGVVWIVLLLRSQSPAESERESAKQGPASAAPSNRDAPLTLPSPPAAGGEGRVRGPEPAGPIEIKPAPLKNNKEELVLPSKFTDVCVGGGGRYLFLHLSGEHKLAVFDVNEAKVTHHIPLADADVGFAAGLNKLMIVLRGNNMIQRWDLTTFKRETEAPLPINGVVKAIAIGSASDGPLLVHWSEGTEELARAFTSFLDIHTLKLLETSVWQGHYRDALHYRASADGQTFGFWNSSSTGDRGDIIMMGGLAKKQEWHSEASHVVPGPDGKVLFTSNGVFSSDLKELPSEFVGPLPVAPRTKRDRTLIPSLCRLTRETTT